MSDVGDAMVRCTRCTRASRRRTSASSCSRPGVADEVDQLGVGLGGIGPVAQDAGEVVEVVGVERAPISSTRLRWLATRPEPDPLVVVVGSGGGRTHAATRWRSAGAWRVGRGSGIVDRLELVAADLGDALERPARRR